MKGDLTAYRRVLAQRHSFFKEDGLDRIVNRWRVAGASED